MAREPVLNQSSARVDATFEQWTRLTDAYAKQFFLLQRGVRSARAEAMRLAQELQRVNQAMQSGA